MPTEQYLIAARDISEQDLVLGEVLQALQLRPNSKILRSVGGPGTQRLVAEMTPEAADMLKEKFASRLIVEIDAPLKF